MTLDELNKQMQDLKLEELELNKQMQDLRCERDRHLRAADEAQDELNELMRQRKIIRLKQRASVK